MKTVNKQYRAWYLHGSPPVPDEVFTEAPSMKRAREWAKSIATERGWRLMDVVENVEKQQEQK